MSADHEEGNRECQTRSDELLEVVNLFRVETENNLRTADTGTHFGILRGLSESGVVAGTNGDDDDVDAVDITVSYAKQAAGKS